MKHDKLAPLGELPGVDQMLMAPERAVLAVLDVASLVAKITSRAEHVAHDARRR